LSFDDYLPNQGIVCRKWYWDENLNMSQRFWCSAYLSYRR
jgi:hypothetical protein